MGSIRKRNGSRNFTDSTSMNQIVENSMKEVNKLNSLGKRKAVGNSTVNSLKVGIWLYFFLLIFEGSLRKWLLPSFATPLLIVRDPIALWLIFKSLQKGYLQLNGYIVSIALVGLLSFFTTMVVGHQNLYVAIFGLRTLLIHFPLMFIIGKVFNRQDILKLGRIMVYICIPMIVLLALQFYSPQSAWVNRGVGGDMEGAGFGGALGYFRAPGTFSFTNGNTMFWGFAAPFIFYFWLVPKQIKKWVLLLATAALIVSIPLSISRTLLFEVGLTLAFTLFIFLRKPEKLSRLLTASVVVLLFVLILSQTSFFQTGTMVFTERFTTANESEGGLVKGVFMDRFFGGMIGAITQTDKIPFFGEGIGMGTNVGSMMLTEKKTFLIAEGEWGRLIGEMGILLGMMVILIRTVLVFNLAHSAFKKTIKGDILPWLLLSFGFLVIFQGQWAQPTALGFSTLVGGLILASLKGRPRIKKMKPHIQQEITKKNLIINNASLK